MRINKAAIDLIKSFEGCELEAYRDPVGVWTIGYGLTTDALPGVTVGAGMTITQKQADEYLHAVLKRFAEKILPGFTRQPTENQFGAFLSLAYNIGFGGFLKSTALRRFNEGDFEGAAEALQWFNKAGGKVLRGLVRRRAAEAALFLSDTPVDTRETAIPANEERGLTQSTTMQAVTGGAISGGIGAVTAVSALDGTAQIVVIVAALVAAAALAWIARERIRKFVEGDR